MSKFLKIIDGIILALFILSALALLVPSFAGYDTTVVNQGMKGNTSVGSVIYSAQEKVSGISAGDRILSLKESSVNVYTVKSYDKSKEKVAYTDGSKAALSADGKYYKVMVVIPLIGYLSIALQSSRGIMILGLALAVVIILFIISEILRHRAEKRMEDDETEEDEFYQDLVQKKKQSEDKDKKRHHGRRERDAEENETDDTESDTEAEGQQNYPQPTAAREMFIKEVPEGMEGHLGEDQNAGEDRETAAEGAETLTAENAENKAAFGSEADKDKNINVPDVQSALEAALKDQPFIKKEETSKTDSTQADNLQEKLSPDEIELAMPVHTAEELLQKAYTDGLDPIVREDEITGVTLIDYSDNL